VIEVRIHKNNYIDGKIEFSDILDSLYKDENILFPRGGWKPHKRFLTDINKGLFHLRTEKELSSINLYNVVYDYIKNELFYDYIIPNEPTSKIYFPKTKPNGRMYHTHEKVDEFVWKYGTEHGYVIW
jgi:hypothetical protein